MTETQVHSNLLAYLQDNLPEKFIKPNGAIRITDFSLASDLTRVTIYNFEHIKSGDGKKIHIDTAQKIVNATDGKIKLDDILDFVTSI